MTVTGKVKRIVWVRDGGCCTICRERVFIEGNEDQLAEFRGEVAHIVALQPDGPRGESPMPTKQRNHENNLMLLCLDHHAEIDTNVERYTVAYLHELMNQHATWLAERLRFEKPWVTKIFNFYYLNIPRLLVQAAFAGMRMDMSKYGEIVAIHELGWELNALMHGFKELLQKIEVKAIPLEQALKLGDGARGVFVSFNQQFRTKNINMPDSLDGYRHALRGNIKTDPQIYAKIGQHRVTLIVDPRWITTVTAFVHFRPSGGRGNFAGVGLVNSIDALSVNVTPLVIGLPSNPFLVAFYEEA